MRAIVFGSPAARAIAEQMRAAEAEERRLLNLPRPRRLTLAEIADEIRERERDEQRLAAWNRWAQGRQQQETTS